MKKKELFISFVILLLLMFVFFYMQLNKNNAITTDSNVVTNTTPAPSNAIRLTQKEANDCIKLEIIGTNPRVIEKNPNGQWFFAEDEDVPLVQSKVKVIASTISNIISEKLVLENAENLNEFGLENPRMFVKAYYQDQSTILLKIGNQTPSQTDTYITVNDNKNVYLLSEYYLKNIAFDDNELIDLNITIPPIDTINYIYFNDFKGNEFEMEEKTDLSDDEKIANQEEGMILLTTLKPLPNRAVYDTNLNELFLSVVKEIQFRKIIPNKGTDSFAVFGFDQPTLTITINSKDILFDVTIGKAFDQYYYAMTSSRKEVFAIDQEIVQKIARSTIF